MPSASLVSKIPIGIPSRIAGIAKSIDFKKRQQQQLTLGDADTAQNSKAMHLLRQLHYVYANDRDERNRSDKVGIQLVVCDSLLIKRIRGIVDIHRLRPLNIRLIPEGRFRNRGESVRSYIVCRLNAVVTVYTDKILLPKALFDKAVLGSVFLMPRHIFVV